MLTSGPRSRSAKCTTLVTFTMQLKDRSLLSWVCSAPIKFVCFRVFYCFLMFHVLLRVAHGCWLHASLRTKCCCLEVEAECPRVKRFMLTLMHIDLPPVTKEVLLRKISSDLWGREQQSFANPMKNKKYVPGCKMTPVFKRNAMNFGRIMGNLSCILFLTLFVDLLNWRLKCLRGLVLKCSMCFSNVCLLGLASGLAKPMTARYVYIIYRYISLMNRYTVLIVIEYRTEQYISPIRESRKYGPTCSAMPFSALSAEIMYFLENCTEKIGIIHLEHVQMQCYM